MSLNCNEINAVLAEMDLCGSFIQEIVQPGYDTLCFRTFKQGVSTTILICTSASACRINITEKHVPKNSKPLRFNEFLKSNVIGMRINSFEQLGFERIIKFDISTWKQRLYMYVRLWSGAANVIVTDEEGTILDCMYRRPAKGEVTGGKYVPEVKELSAGEKEKIALRFPVRTFEDESDDGFDDSPDKFSASSDNFSDSTDNSSALTEKLSAAKRTFNQQIDLFYSEHASVLSRESLLQQAEKWFNVKHSKMTAALEKLEEKQKQFENSEKLRHTGDLILAFGSQANGSVLDCIDYETDKPVHIRLNPDMTVQQNAQNYYEQYKKAVSGMELLLHDIEISRKNIRNLEQEYQAMLNEKNTLKLEQMLRKDTTPKQKNEKPHAGLHYEIDGWTIIAGRTAAENDELLRHTVKGPDLWLHTRDYSGGYIFIKARKNKTVPLDILLYAGNLAVWHSKARKNGQADLYYTHVKYLRRAKNGPKGLVLPTNEKNLFIKLDQQKLNALEEYLCD